MFNSLCFKVNKIRFLYVDSFSVSSLNALGTLIQGMFIKTLYFISKDKNRIVSKIDTLYLTLFQKNRNNK